MIAEQITALARIVEEVNRYRDEPWTVATLAEATGIPARTVYRHLSGATEMKWSHVVSYSRVLGVSCERFIEREP